MRTERKRGTRHMAFLLGLSALMTGAPFSTSTCRAEAAPTLSLIPDSVVPDEVTHVVLKFSEAVVQGVAGQPPTNIVLELIDSPTKVHFSWPEFPGASNRSPVFLEVTKRDDMTISLSIRVDSFVNAPWVRLYAQLQLNGRIHKPRTELFLRPK